MAADQIAQRLNGNLSFDPLNDDVGNEDPDEEDGNGGRVRSRNDQN